MNKLFLMIPLLSLGLLNGQENNIDYTSYESVKRADCLHDLKIIIQRSLKEGQSLEEIKKLLENEIKATSSLLSSSSEQWKNLWKAHEETVEKLTTAQKKKYERKKLQVIKQLIGMHEMSILSVRLAYECRQTQLQEVERRIQAQKTANQK
jgi:DNA-binding transcriptional MerR regulator